MATAKKSIKMRAKLKGDTCEVKALIKHKMETGLRKDKKTGNLIPAHFIQEVKCDLNESNVLHAYWGGSISKNPYLSFAVTGAAKGDKLSLSWSDNKGESDSLEVAVK